MRYYYFYKYYNKKQGLSAVFDAIEIQYKLVLDFFKLEDAGRVLVRGVKDKGDIKGNKALEEAYKLGMNIY